jgi:hypothetical protein
MLTRTLGAQDLDSGVVLSQAMLGQLSSLEMHHIFPKALLYEAGYERGEVNALANFCFLTKGSNLQISASRPESYMPRVEQRVPGALASQWIPTNPELWSIDRYSDFLEARRELLASATNTFLDSLVSGQFSDATTGPEAGTTIEASRAAAVENAMPDERSEDINELVDVLTSSGFAVPQQNIEVADPDTGRVLSVAEALWPGGLQPGQGQPVVLELDQDDFDENALTALGYLVFTATDALRDYAAGLAGNELLDAAEPTTALASNGDAPLAADEAQSRTAAFNLAMKDVYVRAKREAGYNATAYLRMLADFGGIGTAHRLLAGSGVSDGFVALWERGRVDLAVENVVLRPEFAELFSEEELDTARDRLQQYGYEAAS